MRRVRGGNGSGGGVVDWGGMIIEFTFYPDHRDANVDNMGAVALFVPYRLSAWRTKVAVAADPRAPPPGVTAIQLLGGSHYPTSHGQ